MHSAIKSRFKNALILAIYLLTSDIFLDLIYKPFLNQTLFGLRKIVSTGNFRRLTIFHPTVARWLLWKSSAQRMADMFTSVCLFIYPTVYLSVHDGSQLKEASNWSFLRPFCVLMMTMMMTLYSRVWNKRNPWNKRHPALIYIYAEKKPPKMNECSPTFIQWGLFRTRE